MLCRILCYLLTVTVLTTSQSALAQAPNSNRLPPTISHQETLRLFSQQRYEQAYQAAVHRFEWGDEKLHYPLGYMLRHGLGTRADLKQARQHLSIAARSSNPNAQYELAEMLRLGQGGAIDSRGACDLYRKAARRQTQAAFQAALCDLSDDKSATALRQLHNLAAQNHLAASKRLLLHYRQHGVSEVQPQSSYTQALSAWLKEDTKSALQLAIQAIKTGDYRAYAILGESLRRQSHHPAELVKQQVELGRLFGSQLPRFAAGLRLQKQGYAGAACEFYAQAFQAGFTHAARQMGKCLEQGLLAAGNFDKTACGYYSQAFFDGDANSTADWLDCQRHNKVAAIELAKSYDQAKYLNPDFVDLDLSEQICASSILRELAMGVTLQWRRQQKELVNTPLRGCVFKQSDERLQVFVPDYGWLLSLSSAELALPVKRHGLTLASLNREQVRKLLHRDSTMLMPLKLAPKRDVLRLKSTENVEIRLEYQDDGRLQRYVETCNNCSEDSFTWRRQRLQEHFGKPLQSTSSESFEDRRWRIHNWDIQLMMKPQQDQLREIYRAR